MIDGDVSRQQRSTGNNQGNNLGRRMNLVLNLKALELFLIKYETLQLILVPKKNHCNILYFKSESL